MIHKYLGVISRVVILNLFNLLFQLHYNCSLYYAGHVVCTRYSLLRIVTRLYFNAHTSILQKDTAATIQLDKQRRTNVQIRGGI